MPQVEWSADVARAEWIGARLGPFGSNEVTSVVPAGFEAYVRLLHPAHDSKERPIRWSEVAACTGLELHSATSFPEIALLPPDGTTSPIRDLIGPAEGTLSAIDAAALIDILKRGTTSPEDCWFCLWDGYGWDTGDAYAMSFPVRDDEPAPRVEPDVYDGPDISAGASALPDPEDPIPPQVQDGPRVRLPNREYFLYRGGVDAALAFVGSQNQTPNLWWPADGGWCVASEIDLEWTYVGGSRELIDAIVTDRRLEAWPVDPADKHRLQLPPWLVIAVDDAVIPILAGRSGRVQTQLGAVTATARLPERWRHGDLWTTSVRPDGSSDASGWTRLSNRNENSLRETISHQLTWAVIDLLG